MFRDIFGNSPQAKILDFLGSHPRYDYNISDLAEYAEVSRPTLYGTLPKLLKMGILMQTRKVGKSNMYKLNIDNDLVKTILKFDFELANKIAELEEQQEIVLA